MEYLWHKIDEGDDYTTLALYPCEIKYIRGDKMAYLIEYAEGKPHILKFKPDFVDSSGLVNYKLGDLAMSQFCPDGWGWDRKFLYCFVTSDVKTLLIDRMLNQAQLEVTEIMDMLSQFKKCSKIFEELEG